ncbi:tRNA (guanine-N7-)-methyltransferase [Micromonospora phaseoli]|uniref:tRNA (guanine-N(7)-)-methyltransferase n=1 Tax=Micromonospora phaseoli TaxID=1144548 RepID=A0A1H6SSI8_9ACTN|nr:tRNA (guanosine(46)-N7)-methyltransferase TrmB [Micromonospora phaseoli]PZW03939.1 tRNA (guanine-N(7)-)-methyltransferase [Micromonospora phaseoli]GIJ77647.1 tRNA (guanine-N(7)-)-methyltransferase [Micromonospora phaseoli]SEI66562.1 tRNA (guanine-N7-)-methyltransferase [Micromonospora phaseoli]
MTSTDPIPSVAAPYAARTIRTFHPRRGRMSGRQVAALEQLWPVYGLHVADAAPIDPVDLFGRRAPLVLEIGSGMGDTTVEMAAADPDRDYLAVEVHTPGIANLLDLVHQRELGNVRIVEGDALDLLDLLPPDSLDAVHIFFPDPWPKSRHHKRRLIQPAHVARLRSRLAVGGTLHCATDWAAYAESMRATLDADPGLVNPHDGYAPRPAHRPVTRFERRALIDGRPIADLIYRRR